MYIIFGHIVSSDDQNEADDEADDVDEVETREVTSPVVNFVLMTKGRANKPSFKNLRVT